MRKLVIAAAVAAIAGVTNGQTPVDLERLGPAVGSAVPDFAGTDQFGRSQTLRSLMARNGLMLVFFRSADW